MLGYVPYGGGYYSVGLKPPLCPDLISRTRITAIYNCGLDGEQKVAPINSFVDAISKIAKLESTSGTPIRCLRLIHQNLIVGNNSEREQSGTEGPVYYLGDEIASIDELREKGADILNINPDSMFAVQCSDGKWAPFPRDAGVCNINTKNIHLSKVIRRPVGNLGRADLNPVFRPC
jgi:hypothetical protein